MNIDQANAGKLLFALHNYMSEIGVKTVELPSGRIIELKLEHRGLWRFIMVGKDWQCLPWWRDDYSIRDFCGDYDAFANDLLQLKLMLP